MRAGRRPRGRRGVPVYTIGSGGPIGAVQIGRGLDEVDAVLDDVRRRTLILVFPGIRCCGGHGLADRRHGDRAGASPDEGGGGRRHVRSTRYRGARHRQRRGGPSRHRVPPDARRARVVVCRAAAPRTGRRPRAAHTPHQPADQPVGAAPPPRHGTGDATPDPRRPRPRGRRTDRPRERTRHRGQRRADRSADRGAGTRRAGGRCGDAGQPAPVAGEGDGGACRATRPAGHRSSTAHGPGSTGRSPT